MPLLTNGRRELFAQSLACGNSLLQAALASGYKERSAQTTGSVLGKNPKVIARVAEIKAAREEAIAKHSNYTIRDALRETDEALAVARNKTNGAAMVAAVSLKAKLAGLLIERRDVTYRNVQDLSDAELENLIASAESSSDTDGLRH